MTETVHRVPRRRRAATLLAGALLALVVVLLGPAAPASAHATLLSTSPAANSVVSQPPAAVLLTFSEPVSPIAGKLRVTGPDGRADAGEPRVEGTNVYLNLGPNTPNGTYLVTYRVISADGHPVVGAFTFSIGAPSPGGPPAEAEEAATSPVVTTLFPIVRYIGYAGLLLLVGAVLVLTTLWPQRLASGPLVRLAYVGAALIGVATVLEVALEVPYVVGGGLLSGGVDGWKEVLGSRFGTAHLVRLGVLGVSLLLLRPVVRGRSWGSDRILLCVLGVVGLATWSVSGHPGASPAPMISVVADMVHLGSMSIWVGGLVMLFLFVLPRANAVELSAIVPVWSRWATYAVGALILTGIAQALIEVGSFNALIDTRYGWLVMAKAGLVLVILAVASGSRRLVAPIATEEPGAANKLRMIVLAEVAIIALVLGTTAVLVQTTPARTAANQVEGPQLRSMTMNSKLFTLQSDVAPAAIGINEVHLYAFSPTGGPITIEEWKATASLPSQGIDAIEITLLRLSESHAIGQVTLPAAGDWEFTFTLRTTEIDQATVKATVNITS
ncbi:copper resistance CopC/CopD family protein [Luedemannella helvata]|uniref:CopD family protein n=1 Tax=Luedemannella helvata TaxID=349315 RepID=A0ABP4WKW1_9ACTN